MADNPQTHNPRMRNGATGARQAGQARRSAGQASRQSTSQAERQSQGQAGRQSLGRVSTTSGRDAYNAGGRAASQGGNPRTATRGAAGANNPRRRQKSAYGYDAERQSGAYDARQSAANRGQGAYQPRSRGSVKPLDTTYSHRSYSSYASQRRANQPGSAINGASHRNPETASYYDSDRYTAKKQRKPVSKVGIIVAAVVAVAIGVGVWFYFNPAVFSVTVNGTARDVARGTTIDSLINDGVVNPAAGDLLAVDGTVLERGNGYRFAATVNGTETTDGGWVLRPDDNVVVKDGNDATENFTSTEVTVEPESETSGIGAIHAYLDGKPGVTLEKTGEISGKTVSEVQTPPINSGLINYNANVGDEKVIALTFDDGPWPTTTAQILDILEENNAKATFFTIGNQVADHASDVKRAAEAGHQICTHSWDHAEGSGQGVNLTYMSTDEQVQEIQKGYDVIASTTGAPASTVIRTPGGNFYGSLIETLRPLVTAEINWNIDTEDWRRPGAEVIAQRVLAAEPGDVILMHDGGGDRSQTVAALKEALPQLVAKGYRFVTIDELMQIATPEAAATAASEKKSAS